MKITISLPQGLTQQAKAFSVDNGQTLSGLIRQCLKQRINGRDNPKGIEASKVFSRLLGKPVKVVYQEGNGQTQIGKGVLRSAEDGFLGIDGDFSYQIVPVRSIIKISCISSKHDHDDKPAETRGC